MSKTHLFDLDGKIAFVSGASRGIGEAIAHLLATVELAAGHDHMGTLLGQQVGNGLANAAAGTGDESDLAVEVEQVSLGHAVFLVVCRQSVDLAITCRLVCSSSRFISMNWAKRLSWVWPW